MSRTVYVEQAPAGCRRFVGRRSRRVDVGVVIQHPRQSPSYVLDVARGLPGVHQPAHGGMGPSWCFEGRLATAGLDIGAEDAGRGALGPPGRYTPPGATR